MRLTVLISTFITNWRLEHPTGYFIDYNPNSTFWVHEQLLGRPGVELIISDHRHNPFLSKVVSDKIEALKDIDLELWKVYARGATGKITGLILSNWFVVDDIPAEAKRVGIGLDFGFTNDETGCLEVFMSNGELWCDELFYETGLTNPDISSRLKDCGVHRNSEIIADSAEPKSIE
jgi:phage terminase large subunit